MCVRSLPKWLENLDDEDINFIKIFITSSGSLKEVAKIYDVSYPTVRLRLDRLIQKINLSQDSDIEPYVAIIKSLAIEDKIDFETAKLLIKEYKKTKQEV
nr:DUF2089 family protein [Clostridioides sp.]